MLFKKTKPVIYDCITGRTAELAKYPFSIGNTSDCDFQLSQSDETPVKCLIENPSPTFSIRSASGQEFILNGQNASAGEFNRETENTLMVGNNLLALSFSADAPKWLQGMNCSEWFIYCTTSSQKYGPLSFSDLAFHLPSFPNEGSETILLCRGLTQMGFSAWYVKPFLSPPEIPAETEPPEEEPFQEPLEDPGIDTEYGEFTCPVCWLKFNRCDVMNIAVHASLRGDPVLGEEHLQRFLATRFNDRGQALDAMNIPAPDIACPHCRRKLPQGFLDFSHLIFSIIGAPSSGKSYYLSVLVKMLQGSLFKNFGVSFRDADPSSNVILNQMKNQLFSASSPEDAFLAKTELEGAMYETLPRLGRKVPLPKPFIFNISRQNEASEDISVVFYDNAGEHFEPTRNSADSPGAQHIAAASGLFFLFDPLHNEEFKRRITSVSDPQASVKRMDQQDVILAESEVRIKTLLSLDSRQRISTPLAVILGKCDTCLELLGGSAPESPVRKGMLCLSTLRKNSETVRNLLIDLCPSIVANAEAISSDVMYFAASSLGCSPIEFVDSRGVKLIAPDPRKLNPIQIEIPTLWVLSKVAPNLIPSSESE
jgi:hypothetical protein